MNKRLRNQLIVSGIGALLLLLGAVWCITRLYVLYAVALVTLVCFYIIGVMLWFWSRVSDPVTHLTDVARRIAAGSYGVQVEKLGDDEVGDLTDALNEMSEKVAVAEKTRTEFISRVSHELRTPITAFRLAALGLCRLVESGRLTRADMPMLRDALDTARRQSARLERLVHRLLDTSRLDTHRVPPQPEPLDLAYVMEEVLHDFREEIRAAGAEIVLELKPTPGCWDRSFVEQIFTNLLTNALKFAGTRPIEISVAPEGDWARLIVRDHGIGIPKGDQERIFERFERAVSPKDYSGFGIGLTIVRDLLQAMGGRVHVDSDCGQGATFTVELPRKS